MHVEMELSLYDVTSVPLVVVQPSLRGTPCRDCESVIVGGLSYNSDRGVCHGSGRANGVALADSDCDFCYVDCAVDGTVPCYAGTAGRVGRGLGQPESEETQLPRLLGEHALVPAMSAWCPSVNQSRHQTLI
ncbi:hypothetical protein DVH05_017462 [Phytophthora capsici]|nr:hypothetical protein DVH05_017462 [Phytophthora capsici]